MLYVPELSELYRECETDEWSVKKNAEKVNIYFVFSQGIDSLELKINLTSC